MSPGRWEELKRIFDAALDCPPAEREAFVRREAADDPEMLAEALRLIEEHARNTDLLSQPALAAAQWHEEPRYASGAVLGRRFRIVRFIARGGMGEVYEAEDLELGGRVALKAIRRRAALDDRLLAMFKREIQLARLVTHPNVCRIFDLIQNEDPGGGASTILLSMELLDGQTLSDRLAQDGPFRFRDALPLIEEIAAGLQAIHDAGIIHGDLKPGNVMLASRPGESRPRAVVMDFGLAHPVAADAHDQLVRGRTPDYSAPEQGDGAPLSPATDVYCLALLIADMLGVPRPSRLAPDAERMPVRWSRLLRRCLASDPSRRLARPAELATALRASAAPLPRRVKVLAGAAVWVAAGALVASWLYREQQAGTVARQLFTTSESVTVWSASPDGRMLAFTDWDTGDVAVRDIGSGRTKRLSNRTLAGHVYSGGVWNAIFSRDSKRVAYRWMNSRTESDIRTIGVDGSGERAVYPNFFYADPLDWSPDGAHLLLVVSKDGLPHRVISIPSEGGPAEEVKLPRGTQLEQVRYSPDGDGLIFDVEEAGRTEVRRLRRGQETVLAGRPGNSSLIGWSPDRHRLIVSNDRRGRKGIWSVAVTGSGPIGEPEELVPEARNWAPLGITRAGALFYINNANSMDVYTAVLDLAARRAVSEPRPVMDRFMGSYFNPAWSDDGRKLVFTSNYDPEHVILIVRDVTSGATRELRPDVKFLWRPQWFEHDAALIAPGATRDGAPGMLRVDPKTGKTNLYRARADIDAVTEGVWSADGRWHFNRFQQMARGIFRMNVATGKKKVLYVPPAGVDVGLENLALSPDGRTLAFHARNDLQGSASLMLIPADGGEARALLTVSQPEELRFGAFAWAQDSKSLLVSRTRLGRSELWLIPANGTSGFQIEFPLMGIFNLRLNRDGRTIAFMTPNARSEVWVLRNFL